MTGKAKRVLLIDDHEMSRRGLQAMLSTTDLVEVVGEAGNCEAGLARITALQPDIVLLDIRMPGVDGLACLGEIKSSRTRWRWSSSPPTTSGATCSTPSPRRRRLPAQGGDHGRRPDDARGRG
jgi:CheY-like chemotaxis protein